MHRHPHIFALLTSTAALVYAALAHAEELKLTPLHANGIYAVGEKVGWKAELPANAAPSEGGYAYTVKKNAVTVVDSGQIDPAARPATITAMLNEPGMLLLEIKAMTGDAAPQRAAAAVAPAELRPVVERPADFDEFWAAKLKLLESIPAEPVLTPGDSGKPGVDYATLRMNNIDGSHIYGQFAKPAREGKFPAMLLLQWAGVYPLEKTWAVERAAEGWLVVNVSAHDMPGFWPADVYASLPKLLQNYNSIYDGDRDRSYFLRMYLGDYRAAEYLAQRPDWDGRVFLVTGTSMGGQQSFIVAGLHPKVTHMIVHVPAGADAHAALHGRAAGYPFWEVKRKEVAEASRYFDTINFASRIRATSLVSMGFLDDVCPPEGIWTAFNQIQGPKEVVPLVYARHNHQSTAEQQQAYTDRSAAWLNALVKGEQPKLLAP